MSYTIIHVYDRARKGLMSGTLLATELVREFFARTVGDTSQAKRADRIGVDASQMSRWRKKIEASQPVWIQQTTAGQIRRFLKTSEAAFQEEEFAKGVRFALERIVPAIVPALEGLRDYAPDLIPKSPANASVAGKVDNVLRAKDESKLKKKVDPRKKRGRGRRGDQ